MYIVEILYQVKKQNPELGTCGILWAKKNKITYFFKTYSLLPISALVLFKKPTSRRINYN